MGACPFNTFQLRGLPSMTSTTRFSDFLTPPQNIQRCVKSFKLSWENFCKFFRKWQIGRWRLASPPWQHWGGKIQTWKNHFTQRCTVEPACMVHELSNEIWPYRQDGLISKYYYLHSLGGNWPCYWHDYISGPCWQNAICYENVHINMDIPTCTLNTPWSKACALSSLFQITPQLITLQLTKLQLITQLVSILNMKGVNYGNPTMWDSLKKISPHYIPHLYLC